MENIKKACIEMAYDNGMVNRYQTEEEAVSKMLMLVVQNFSEDDIREVDTELAKLSDEGLIEAATGEGMGLISYRADCLLNVAFGEVE